MSIVGIVSMKGGVGKTSTTANLAAAVAERLGRGQVSVLDLDPQNSLRLHFGLGGAPAQGICQMALQHGRWQDFAQQTASGMACMPYGKANEQDREDFEALLADQPFWLGEQLHGAGLADRGVVLIDTPPGPSVYLRQVFACADIVLMVLLADAGSYATVPAMESWVREMQAMRPGFRAMYVLNQVDTSLALSRDVGQVLRQHLGERLAQVGVHRDEAVGEALAFQQPVLHYDPHCQATRDVRQLAGWLLQAVS